MRKTVLSAYACNWSFSRLKDMLGGSRVCLYTAYTVKTHFKALGLYNFKRGFGRAYKRGAYIRVGL